MANKLKKIPNLQIFDNSGHTGQAEFHKLMFD